MRDYSFFKKTLSYLSALEKGHADKLVKEEWVTKEEVKRMITILEKLFLVKKKSTNWISITDKGLNILSYFNNNNDERILVKIIQMLVKT